ncbi:MAG: BamA/TamA family outer membrane protein [Elusimicrobiota bacterium]
MDARSEAQGIPGKTIGRITIDNRDIFDPTDPSESKWIYRAANVLHIQTNDSVIRLELLFKEGDPYDPDLIEETERNLRRFKFLRRVRITTEEHPDGVVDVVVHTKDTWTLEPQFNFSRVGNKSTTKMGIVERNLLGTGKRMGAFIHRRPDGTHNSFSYKDQQFLGRKMSLTGDYLSGTDFRQYGASLSKFFSSSQSKNSFEISNFFNEEVLPAYRDGHEVGQFETESRQAVFLLGRSFGSTTKMTRQGTVAYRHETRKYEPVSGDTVGFLKPPLALSVVELGADWKELDFIKERHIEKFDRDEDFDLGAGAGFTFGVGQNWEANRRTELLPQLRGQYGHLFQPGHFVLGGAKYNSRIANDKTDNLLFSLDLQYFNRLRSRNTLAVHLAYDHGYRLDPENYLLLGEDTGLRGYGVGEFSGERRFLFNLEDRMFFAEDVLHLFSLGGAVFFDSGYSWNPENTMGLSDLRSSVGIGFRVALSRSSRNEPIRFDLAYALNNNDQNSRLVFSIQSGLKFGGLDEERTKR